jgi:hypothetical protein
MNTRFLSAVFLSACTIATPGLFAASIGAGSVNFTGTAGVSAISVDFFGDPSSGCSTAGVGVLGCFAANAPLTGVFATGLVPLTLGGTIQDLVNPPISGVNFLNAFITFQNGVIFDLTYIVPGGAPPCDPAQTNNPNYSCTPVISGVVSPFTLTNSSDASNASVFFNVQVSAHTGATSSGFTPYVGAFNTPSAGKNIAGILLDINSGQTVNAAYSANFTGSDVPEPGTVALIGIGLGAIVFSRLRRNAGARG